MRTKFQTVDEYIRSFPRHVQALLRDVRRTIQKSAPEGKEKISYGIPTFTLGGNLVFFAGYKNHIGFYPTPGPIQAFKRELSRYESAKGTIRFPIDKPLPLGLIGRIVRYRVKQYLERSGRRILKNKL